MTTEADKLLTLIPADGSAIGNIKLRRQARMDEEPYFAAQKELVQAGLILTGRGRGGSVRLASVRLPDPVEVVAVKPVAVEPPEETVTEQLVLTCPKCYKTAPFDRVSPTEAACWLCGMVVTL